MSTLIPTPVTLADLADATAPINLVNDGIVTQEVSPRTRGRETIAVVVTDDNNAVWVQKDLGGEWLRGNIKDGNNVVDGAGISDVILPV